METVETLGNYEIRRTLGRGAMGIVYEGWDPRIERSVAIKTIRVPSATDEELRAEFSRFRREAQAAGRLVHPNIVTVYEYGETGDLAFIAMEYVEGPTLKSLLEQQGRLAMPEIRQVMQDVLAGLQYSHDRGVVHRDIKPANIMLTSTDRTVARAKIADFGIARIESSGMTQTGTIMGTPAYMSPEQFVGEPVDARSDIYSAGVMLYQLLTGDRPFDGGFSAIMHKVLNTEPPPPSQIAVAVPPEFDAIVRKAMAKRPGERYPSAAAFAEAMRITDAPEAEQTMVALPPPKPVILVDQPVAAVARARRSRLAAAVGLAMLAGGGAFLLRRSSEPHIAAPGDAGSFGTAAPPAGPSPAASPQPVAPAAPVVPTAAGPLPATPAVSPPAAASPPSASSVSPSESTATAVSPATSPPTAPDTPAAPPAAPARTTPQSTPETPTPSAAVVRDGLAGLLAAQRCGLLDGVVADSRETTVTGFAASDVQADLRRAVGTIPGIGPIEWRVTTVDARYCPVLDVLRPIWPRERPALDLAEGRTALHDGERIRPRVGGLAFPAFVTVDYIASDGGVQHLYPQQADPALRTVADPVVALPSGASLALGDPSPGHPEWAAGEPFGTDLIIAVAASQPLFAAPRPANAEDAAVYLRDLAAAIERAREGGVRLAASMRPVEVVAK
jgi:serine/threonine-protein kinase